MRVFKRILVVAAALALLTNCRKKEGANWDVDALVPIASTDMNISNFLGDTLFSADANHLLHVRFKKDIISLLLDSLFALPDTVLSVPLTNTTGIALPIQPGATFPLSANDLELTPGNGIDLRIVKVHSGSISLKLTNDLSQPLKVDYVLSEVKKDGIPLSISEIVPPNAQPLIRNIDLSGYTFNLRGPAGNLHNTVLQDYTVTLPSDAQPVTVQPNQGAHIEVTYSQIVPDYADGFFGQQVVTFKSDTSNFVLLNNFKASNFLLSDATMKFSVENSIGAEFSASFNNIRSINSETGKSLLLSGHQLDKMNINAAYQSNGNIVVTPYPVIYDKSNSNIPAFISVLPDGLAYAGTVTLNPVYFPGLTNFVFYNTGIKIKADIDVPLRFTADYFELKTEADIDVSSVSQLDNVKGGQFAIAVSNGFPFEARVQALMLDARGQVLDSLFLAGNNVIAGGQVNSLNEVSQASVSRILIPVSVEKVANLKRSRKIRFISRFNMPVNPPEIPILGSYKIQLGIVAEINYNVGI